VAIVAPFALFRVFRVADSQATFSGHPCEELSAHGSSSLPGPTHLLLLFIVFHSSDVFWLTLLALPKWPKAIWVSFLTC